MVRTLQGRFVIVLTIMLCWYLYNLLSFSFEGSPLQGIFNSATTRPLVIQKNNSNFSSSRLGKTPYLERNSSLILQKNNNNSDLSSSSHFETPYAEHISSIVLQKNNNSEFSSSSLLDTTPYSERNSRLNECIESRGTSGHWYIDEEMGRKTFYTNGYRSTKWYRINKGDSTMVYPGNKYAWKDTSLGGGLNNKNNNNNNDDTMDCQIHPMNKISFCETMQKLQIKRILFVGDSLAGSQRDSLISILRDIIVQEKDGKKNIKCSQNFSITYDVRRENLGPNYRQTNVTNRTDATREHRQHFGPEIPYCTNEDMESDYCPWNLVYNKTNQKTLLILNQGAHFHSVETFSASFDLFVNLFNSIAHPGDIVIYRNTVPGHYDCFNKEGGFSPPNMTHDKFLERYATTMYDWNLFDIYNQYAKEKLSNDLTPTVTMHYLNVYNMTVLRPDQHWAATDCLHYSHPGPVDYWNHLLFTNLADLAKKKINQSIE